MKRITQGLGSLLVIVAVFIGAPIGLVKLGRLDLVGEIHWGTIFSTSDDGSLLLLALTVIGWLAWAAIVLSLLGELVGVVSNSRVSWKIPGMGWARPISAALVLALVGLFTSSNVVALPKAEAVPEPKSTSTTATQQENLAESVEAGDESQSIEVASTQVFHHLVEPGEDLWTLAQTYFGDGARWRDIVAANDTSVTDPVAELQPGSILLIPVDESMTVAENDQNSAGADLSSLRSIQTGFTERSESMEEDHSQGTELPSQKVVVKTGDSLWKIAEQHLGDPERWPEIYELNRDLISNPDLIEIGWELTLPIPDESGSLEALNKEELTETSASLPLETSSRQLPQADLEMDFPVPEPSQTQPPETQPPETPSAESQSSKAQSQRTESSEVDPVRAIAGAIASLSAVGIVGVLAARRRMQLLQRKLGTRIALPEEPEAKFESALAVLAAKASKPEFPVSPTSVVIGTINAEPVIIDLEVNQVTLVHGLPEHIYSMMAGVVTGLSCSEWSQEVRIHVVGKAADWVPSLDDPRIITHPDTKQGAQVLIELARRRKAEGKGAEVETLRAQPDLAEAWVSEVFLFTEEPDQLTLAEIRQALGLQPLGISVMAAAPPQDCVHGITVTEEVAKFNDETEFTPQLFDAPARRALITLFDVTGAAATEPAPWWPSDVETQIAGTPPLPSNISYLSSAIHKSSAIDTPQEENRMMQAEVHPKLMLLGPIELRNTKGQLPSKAIKQCIEYCAWIHLNPAQTATAMGASLLVAESTRRSNMSRLRAWLGNDETGEQYLPDAYSGRIQLHPEVTSDWEQLQVLMIGGVNRASEVALIEALRLVRGAPLADAAPGQWHWAEGMRTDAASMIRDIGVVLADLALERGDLDLARWAATRALAAAPEDELLLCARLRTEHLARNHQEVDRLVKHITRQARVLGVDLLDETVTTLQEVMEGGARARSV